MDQAGDTASPSDAELDNDAAVRLFNDVHFQNTRDATGIFAPFALLPTELRLHIWLLFLRQYRMIEVRLMGPGGDDRGNFSTSGRQSYSDRNHLGKVVSGGGYRLEIRGRGFAATFSPLLWVSRESRQVALNFYRVHLPFPEYKRSQLLYLNPEYDVLYAQPEMWVTLLPDVLHDVRAYDPKDQGLAHLAIHSQWISQPASQYNPSDLFDLDIPRLAPERLHPAAAESFADILRTKLRSVLCVSTFQSSMRGIGQPPGAPSCAYHFAQTFPLRRRGLAVGALEWFETDPRWGVEFDLLHVPLTTDPRRIARCWEKMEASFGINQRPKDDAFRFYICPSLYWPGMNQMLGQTGQPDDRPREGIARHLREEAEEWLVKRQRLLNLSTDPDATLLPREGSLLDAERFEKMETVPSTAIGMWVFPPEAFKEGVAGDNIFDVSATRPGLLLFDL